MWIDREHNVVIYNDPERAERVVRSVPGAKSIDGNGLFAFPNTLYNLQLARWIGLAVPPPLADYDWPGRFTPFAKQRDMSNFMVAHPRCLNLSDMGTGKSLGALWAADYIMKQQPGTRALIVAPLSTLHRVWSDAIFQHFIGRRRCVVLHGSAKKRKELLAKPFDFYIVNFDGVAVIKKELQARNDIQIVIIDEASAYRDGTTKRHRTARAVLATRSYLWLMTGTPTPNLPTDSYGLAKLVNNAFGESFLNCKSRMMEQVSKWKWLPKPGAHAMAHRLMQPSIRVSIDECIDLPPQLVEQRDVELSDEQREAYKTLKRDCVVMLEKGEVTAVNSAVVRLKLIQIACGAVYGEDHAINRLDAQPRLDVMREVLEQCNDKVIIFAPLRSVVELIFEELKNDYACAIVNGTVSEKTRAVTFRDFQEQASPRILIADPATMAHGLTLTAATAIIWYAPTDRAELYQQANKRIDRPGQTKTNIVVQLAATPIERGIYDTLEGKAEKQELILQLAKEGSNGSDDQTDSG